MYPEGEYCETLSPYRRRADVARSGSMRHETLTAGRRLRAGLRLCPVKDHWLFGPQRGSDR